jgi:asparagine synthase (glutamine-hydrolysing)
LTAKDALAVIPKLPSLYDEPFSDDSGIPTFLVSQMAREYVTVSLSGDGGDELFGGYNRYFSSDRIWQKVGSIPKTLRQIVGSALTSLSPQTWNRILANFNTLLPAIFKESSPGDKLHLIAEFLAVSDREEIYKTLVSHWKESRSISHRWIEKPQQI